MGLVGNVEIDGDVVRVAQLHQVEVLLQEGDGSAERDILVVALVEQVPHHPGHVHDAVLGLFGIDVHEGMDVVERVHDEVGVDLVTQVIQFLLEALFLELSQMLFLFFVLVIDFHAQVGAYHHDDENEHIDVVPVDGRLAFGRWRYHLDGIPGTGIVMPVNGLVHALGRLEQGYHDDATSDVFGIDLCFSRIGARMWLWMRKTMKKNRR